jgi:catechol 2,3-dioxygenase-like lactoylglutathione lyase family enzyme
VRDLNATLKKVEAAQFKVLTKNDQQVMFLGPDDLKVELTSDPNLSDAVVNHHIHFYSSNVDAMKKWYADTFSAIPGKRGRFEAADLPGVNLTFAPSESALPGTKGRVLDHIGFEVKDLEAFCKNLEAGGAKFDIAYRKIPQLGISIAFITDPWGTYIELTEGLDKL